MKNKSNRYAKSLAAHEAALKLMPGGVNSPVRAYGAVGRTPIAIREGKGCWVSDIDGNRYVDYVGSYGPLILGHTPEPVVVAVTKAASRGLTFGMPTELENQLAEAVVDAVESIDVVRFVNSGTEAVMSALRVARGSTGRSKVVKCIGGYHGHFDGLLVQAGSGAMTLGVPSSAGVSTSMVGETLLMKYNDIVGAREILAKHGEDVACVIVEPIAGNMGCVPPCAGYLAALRELCDDYDVLLVFDEVMTGFRVGYGGAQRLYNVTPDLTTLGKIVGGGMPCAAYGGSEELMRLVAPDGPIYQAGTLSGNPLAMAAGLVTLELLRGDDVYEKLEVTSAALEDGLCEAAKKIGVAVQINRVGSMLTVFFTDKLVVDYDSAVTCDTDAFARFFGVMLDEGVTLPPSQFEAWFVSLAHDDEAVEHTILAARKAFETTGDSA